MEYLIIGLLVVVILLQMVFFIKNKNTSSEVNIVERLGKLETGLSKDFAEFKLTLIKTLDEDFDKFNEK